MQANAFAASGEKEKFWRSAQRRKFVENGPLVPLMRHLVQSSQWILMKLGEHVEQWWHSNQLLAQIHFQPHPQRDPGVTKSHQSCRKEVLLRDHCTTKMSETSFTHVKLSSETEATLFRLNLFYLLPSLHPLQVHQSSLKRFRWAFNNLDNCNAAASRSIIGVMSSSSSSLSEVGPSTKPFEGLKPWRSLS